MEPLYIYNQDLFWQGNLKRIVKNFLGKNFGGPQSVFNSLTLGLNELGVPFKINASLPKESGVVCVLSGVNVLRWTIAQKQQGRISKIIAGPNLVVGSEDFGGVIKDPAIDVFIVPSEWVKDYYSQAVPQLRDKIRIWPAGVGLPEATKGNKIYDFLVYGKTADENLKKQIISFLESKGFKYCVLNYGKFSQKEYFSNLEKSKNVIYLAESESQGLAMFESWARGVPVLVWERGFWKTGSYEWKGITASPYTAPENGMRFKDFENFKKILPDFISKKFAPREFIENNFSNKICAQKYLDIINNA